MLSPETLPSQYLQSAGGANQVLISCSLVFFHHTSAWSKKEENWHIYLGTISTFVGSSIFKGTLFEIFKPLPFSVAITK